jgi:hypothetical protein
MKSLITVSLLSLSCIWVDQASAEPFNDRGPDWMVTVSPGNAPIAGSANHQTLAEVGFNDRSPDWVAVVVPGQGSSECQPGGYVASSYGFNDKSFPSPSLTTTPVSGAMLAGSSTRQDYPC